MKHLQPSVATDEASLASPPPARPTAQLESVGEGMLLHLAGHWTVADPVPGLGDLTVALAARRPRRLSFDTTSLMAWDSRLLAFVSQLLAWCAANGITAEPSGLPAGVRRLLTLAAAVPAHPPETAAPSHLPFVARVGVQTLAAGRALQRAVSYLGEVAQATAAAAGFRARFRGIDLLTALQTSGAEALPIVSLISFLSGMILAFVGALQLRPFGAQVYVADLVAIAMVQEMGALMTGIIMAGRSGATFAAQIGSMQANEEIDALNTLGISPIEFLILPRTVALVAMMPLLTLYADILGILGGALIGILLLQLKSVQYWLETRHALLLSYFVMGLIKAVVYGIVIALTACFQGLRSARSSTGVGTAVTAAVVTSIVLIVCADAVLTVIYHVLGY